MQKMCGFHFFCFRPESLFLDKSGQKKNQNCLLKQKIGTKTNLNMQNSIEILHQTNLNMLNYVENVRCSLFLLQTRKTLFGQIWSKNQNCHSMLEFSTKTNLNMRNSMMFTFSVFDHKYLSWANLIQKFKIVQREI